MNSHDQKTEHRQFSKPDDVREFPRGRVEILKIGGGRIEVRGRGRPAEPHPPFVAIGSGLLRRS